MRFNFILAIFLSLGLLGCKQTSKPEPAPNNLITPAMAKLIFPTLICKLEPDYQYICTSHPQQITAEGATWVYYPTFDSPDWSFSSGDLRSTIKIDDNPRRYLNSSDNTPLRHRSLKANTLYFITYDGATYIARMFQILGADNE